MSKTESFGRFVSEGQPFQEKTYLFWHGLRGRDNHSMNSGTKSWHVDGL
jgi:hypothetical protein